MGWFCHFVCVSIPFGQTDPSAIANANSDPPTPADRFMVGALSWYPVVWFCVCVARVLLRLSLTLTQAPLPQLASSWLVLDDSTLWAGFVPSSVFQLRLANPSLTLSLRLTQTALLQLTARSQFMAGAWSSHPVVWLCVRAARTLVLLWISAANRSSFFVVLGLQTGSQFLHVQDNTRGLPSEHPSVRGE